MKRIKVGFVAKRTEARRRKEGGVIKCEKYHKKNLRKSSKSTRSG